MSGIAENCPVLPNDILNEYVYDTLAIKGKCCKEHKAIACKVNGTSYKVGETWPSPDMDKCKTVTCIATNLGDLVKQESVETCNKNCSNVSIVFQLKWITHLLYSKCLT